MVRPKIPVNEALVKAVKQYHHNRDTLKEKWDKPGDIAVLADVANKDSNILNVQSICGSFWVTWKQGVQALYNEKFPDGAAVAVRTENGEWKNLNGVDFWSGEDN